MKQQSGFKKGNREATKRKRRGGGRPTNRELGIREEVKRLMELELEKHVLAVIGAGRKIATGVKRRKHNPKTPRRRPGDSETKVELSYGQGSKKT
jgi:hypothetical protein